MTLSTDIYINTPIGAHKVHAKVNEILGIVNPEISDNPEFDHWEKDADGKPSIKVYKGPESMWCLENTPGQGFPAWVMVHYRPEGPAVGPELNHDTGNWPCQTPENEAEWKYPEEGPCTYRRHFPHCVHVDLDTAYSYRDEQGRNCSDLHVYVILKLGEWLDEQGVTDWEWTNEYTGVTYKRFEGLETMNESGKEAESWFSTVARPAIERHAVLTQVAGMSDEEMHLTAAQAGIELGPGQAEEFRQHAQDLLDNTR